MRATVLTPLILLSWSLQAVGQTSPMRPEQKVSGGEQTPVASTPATSGSPVATGPELLLVVALFRHGVRAPLKDIDDPAKPHAGSTWPSKSQWGVNDWGDLTPQGIALARALGRDYAENYKKTWPAGFRSFL